MATFEESTVSNVRRASLTYTNTFVYARFGLFMRIATEQHDVPTAIEHGLRQRKVKKWHNAQRGETLGKTTAWLLIALLSMSPLIGSETDLPAGKAATGRWGIETKNISKTVSPGDDFYTYVNEGWINSTKIPANTWDFGAFNELGLKTSDQIETIIHDASKLEAPAGDPRQQIGDLYSSYMDVSKIEALGISPIQNELNQLRAIRTHEEVARWMASPRSSSIACIYVFVDDANPEHWLVRFDQISCTEPILGLAREQYQGADEPFRSHRTAYAGYIADTLQHAGIDNPARRASDILALETKIAAEQWNLEQIRDRKANYHFLHRADLDVYASGFPWQAFLSARQVGTADEIVLGTDTAVKAVAKLFAETPVDTWVSYLLFHWIQNQVEFLPSSFRQASFDFYGRLLDGKKDEPSRDQAAVQFVNSNLGVPVGKLYVAQYFPPERKAQAIELFSYLKRALGERLATVNWLDDETRREALAKLASLRLKIGYPDAWRDCSTLSISRDDLIGNFRRILDSNWADQRARLDGQNRLPVWNESPQTVDASFSPQLNAIKVPAAILEPPFFDPHADPAVNFGSIGAIIGHEIGHAFDDQGANFDSKGRLRDWWTDYARRQFHERTSALVEQYNAFSPLNGLHLNGQMTLGENIGDLTGVSLAYRAYRMYVRDHYKGNEPPVLDGYNGDQRYFLSWAQTWHYVATDSAMEYIVKNGYHPPAQYRVNGVVRNIDAWYAAFDVTPKQKLYLPPDARVHLW